MSEVFLAQRPRLLAHARALLRDAQQAEDVVQESYLRVVQASKRPEITNPAGFLFRTVHNLALDLLRQRQRRPLADLETLPAGAEGPAAPGGEERLMARERLEILALALNALPRRAAEALILSRLRGWPQHRIAQELGVSERTIQSDLREAMLHCRAALERREK